MIEKNSVDVERIALGSTDIETVYQGTDKIWELAPKYLNYQGLSDTREIESAQYRGELGNDYISPNTDPVYFYDDSLAFRYDDNIQKYTIQGTVANAQNSNNGINSIQSKITIPSKYKRQPIYSIGYKALSTLPNIKYITIKKDIFLDTYCFGKIDDFESANPQPTSTTFSNRKYYYLDETDYTYKLATEYTEGTSYYITNSTIDNMVITEYTPDLSTPQIVYRYAKLGDNNFAICLGFTPLSNRYVYTQGSQGIYTTVKLHDDCKYIYDDAFLGYDKLFQYKTAEYIKDIVFNDKLIEIGFNAFLDTTHLRGSEDYSSSYYMIEFPDSLRWINKYAFANSGSEVTDRPIRIMFHQSASSAYSNIEYIGEGAFAGCNKIEMVSIKNKNPLILKRKAFYNCTNLKYVDLNGANIEEIESYVFSLCTNLKFHNSTTVNYVTTYVDTNPVFYPVNYTRSYSNEINCYLGKCLIYGKTVKLSEYVIDNGTEHIAGRAFVTSPTTESFNELTLTDMSLIGPKSIVFPNSLISIGEWCFGGTFGNTMWYLINSIRFEGIYELANPQPTSSVHEDTYYVWDGYGFVEVYSKYIDWNVASSHSFYKKKDTPNCKLKTISTGAFSICASTLNQYYKYINLTSSLKKDLSTSDILPILYNTSTLPTGQTYSWFIDKNFSNVYVKVNSTDVWRAYPYPIIRDNFQVVSSYPLYSTEMGSNLPLGYRMIDLPMTLKIVRSLAFSNSTSTYKNETGYKDSGSDTNEDAPSIG